MTHLETGTGAPVAHNGAMSAYPPLVAPLGAGPVDVIGDVHGEIAPLRELLAQLGYDGQGAHPEDRRVVFVGDLTDRGPESQAVAELAIDWTGRGRAQCILGNHELNIARNDIKPGNAWILDPSAPEQQPGGEFAHSRVATPEFRARYVEWLRTLPLALERADLRIVHAAWVPGSIDSLRSPGEPLLDVFNRYEHDIELQLRREGIDQRIARERDQWRKRLHDRKVVVPLLRGIAAGDERHQMGNPIRVATSGVEREAQQAFWSSGKWRMVDRVRWWEEYRDGIPVICGHYWRRVKPPMAGGHASTKADLFEGVAPAAWLGPDRNVFCVDYSIGGRYEERKRGRSGSHHTALMAMRWPERELWGEAGRVAPGTDGFAQGPSTT
jgi:hypothetical protein